MARKSLLIIGLAAGLTGCLGGADAQKANDAEAKFFTEMAAKQYAQMYSEAAPELQTTATSDQFVAFMTDFDNHFGACQPATKKAQISTNSTSNGFFQDQGYTQVCANGTANETLTIVVRNGEAKVAGFKFTS